MFHHIGLHWREGMIKYLEALSSNRPERVAEWVIRYDGRYRNDIPSIPKEIEQELFDLLESKKYNPKRFLRFSADCIKFYAPSSHIVQLCKDILKNIPEWQLGNYLQITNEHNYDQSYVIYHTGVNQAVATYKDDRWIYIIDDKEEISESLSETPQRMDTWIFDCICSVNMSKIPKTIFSAAQSIFDEMNIKYKILKYETTTRNIAIEFKTVESQIPKILKAMSKNKTLNYYTYNDLAMIQISNKFVTHYYNLENNGYREFTRLNNKASSFSLSMKDTLVKF